MLSASTVSSSVSSNAFSSASPGLSTPSSQYSNDSSSNKRKGNNNPLIELIETEQSYMETLRMIDSQIAPIWMKQMTSAAPDFSELLKYIHDILKVNKRFCMRLTKIAAQPQSTSELGDVLMQWVNDLEVPYANYARSYIPHLNQRHDILDNPSIRNLLQNLSNHLSYEINLESFFNAPIQQLKYYKTLYNRLLEGTDSGQADHKLLLAANKRINTIMMMSNTASPIIHRSTGTNVPFSIQTDFSSDLATFERKVNCSRTMDLHTGAQINYNQLRLSSYPGTQLVMRDSFILLTNNGSVPVHLVLTTEVLVICRDLDSDEYFLLYPPVPISDITVKASKEDDSLVSLTVLGKKQLLMRANSKEIRNTWIGVDNNDLSAHTPRPLGTAAQKMLLLAQKPKKIRDTDIFTYYSESGGVSPLESSDEDNDGEGLNARDTIMKIYDTHMKNNKVPPKKGSTNVQPEQPENAASTAASASAHVQMTFLPTVQMATMSISSSSSSPAMNKLNPSSPTTATKHLDTSGKPSSPRAVEVQQAVIPKVMQAVTQKTDDYLTQQQQKKERFQPIANPHIRPHPSTNSNNNTQPPMANYPPNRPYPPANNSSAQPMMHPQQTMIPRTSSIRGQHPPMGQQQPSPRPMNYPGVQQYSSPKMQQSIANYPVNMASQSPVPIATGQSSPLLNYRPTTPIATNSYAHKPLPGQPYVMDGPYSNRPYNPPRPPQAASSPHLQHQVPGRHMPSPTLAHHPEDSPPRSPNVVRNDIRKILYSSSQCEVFHWTNQSWYAADGPCLLQVRLTHTDRACVAVQLQNTGQLYLNAWIVTSTMIRQPSPTDVNISLYMGTKKENYLIHFGQPQDATVFANILRNVQQQEEEEERVEDEPAVVETVNVPQTLKPVMQCKAKLFVQNETSNWSTFGSVTMRISQQSPSMRMLIQIENGKSKLVDAIVRSGNVERIGPKRISFLLVDETSKTSIVYMIHLREEQTGNKIYEYLRTRNAENGW
ncbi:MAG: hypothetical protein EXX96DRAFT_548348 [Benjaminiella poitrasii]|nr:MAG: hypothetical protein EXX96DRAFT_548348 [Benjaminiella poitrasii]